MRFVAVLGGCFLRLLLTTLERCCLYSGKAHKAVQGADWPEGLDWLIAGHKWGLGLCFWLQCRADVLLLTNACCSSGGEIYSRLKRHLASRALCASLFLKSSINQSLFKKPWSFNCSFKTRIRGGNSKYIWLNPQTETSFLAERPIYRQVWQLGVLFFFFLLKNLPQALVSKGIRGHQGKWNEGE